MFRKKSEIIFETEIHVDEDDNGEFYAYCPALAGVHVDGKTKEEAIENVKAAMVVYLASLIKHKEPIPLRATEKAEAPEKIISFPTYKTENVVVSV